MARMLITLVSQMFPMTIMGHLFWLVLKWLDAVDSKANRLIEASCPLTKLFKSVEI